MPPKSALPRSRAGLWIALPNCSPSPGGADIALVSLKVVGLAGRGIESATSSVLLAGPVLPVMLTAITA